MENLQEELKRYPSSFNVKESMPIKKDMKTTKDKLLLELEAEDEYYIDMERHRTWNLISFLWFVLGYLEEAKTFNQKVLDSDSRNIIALSNKAWFSLEEDNIKQCKDITEQLNSISKDRIASLIAKAEIAFTYSRFGIRCSKYSKDKYKNVIGECEDILETNCEPVKLVEYYCIWMFGYALVQRRQMNLNNIMDENSLGISRDDNKHLVELYCRIIRLKGQSTCLKRYKARSYVELGFLAYNIEQSRTIYPESISEIFPADQIKETNDFFEEALGVFSNDVYVLERSGKYFRYRRDIERSIRLLNEAITIKGSSFGYHHLALSLRRKLDVQIGNLKDIKFDSCETKGLTDKSSGCQMSRQLKKYSCKDHYTENYPSFTSFDTETRSSITSNNSSCSAETDSQNLQMSRNPRHDMLKTPRYPRRINYEKNKDSVDMIIMYFKKACKVSANPSAMYDNGLLYRQIGYSKKALKIFTALAKNKDGHSSRVQVANAYEQAAFCIDDLLKRDNEVGRSLDEDMDFTRKMYLKSSLEIACNLALKIPVLKELLLKSAPTLKTLLSRETSTKEDKQYLLFLHRKMENYKEALDVLAELEKLAESDEEKAEVIQEKVKDYLKLGHYDDAVIALDLIACLPDRKLMVEHTLYRKVQIEAGVDGLRRGHAEIARQRLKNAFDDSSRNESSPGDGSDTLEEEYDLFILCNLDDEDNGIKLMNIMNKTGLCTTVNVDSKLPGTPVLAGMEDVMNQSKQFVIMFDFDYETADYAIKNKMQVFTDMLLQIVQKKSIKTFALVMMESSAKVPDNILHLPYKRIDMDLCAEYILCADDKDFFQNENILNGVKNILLSLAAVI